MLDMGVKRLGTFHQLIKRIHMFWLPKSQNELPCVTNVEKSLQGSCWDRSPHTGQFRAELGLPLKVQLRIPVPPLPLSVLEHIEALEREAAAGTRAHQLLRGTRCPASRCPSSPQTTFQPTRNTQRIASLANAFKVALQRIIRALAGEGLQLNTSL